MKLSDFKGLFKRETLTVESVENPQDDYYEIKMKPALGMSWSAGEHGVFTLPKKKIAGRKWRAFSVASIPSEGFVMIGTRTGNEISGFKKVLTTMKKGDKVNVIGPFGWFKVQDSKSPIVMVAGGVGITPFRALLKQVENDSLRPIDLVYTSSDYYLFGDEIEAIASMNDQITLYKPSNRQETESIIASLVANYKGNAFYYISGQLSFIKTIKKQITKQGISRRRIINDPFIGY